MSQLRDEETLGVESEEEGDYELVDKALKDVLGLRPENQSPPESLLLAIWRAMLAYDIVDDHGQRVTEYGRRNTPSWVELAGLILANRAIVDEILFADRNDNYFSDHPEIVVGPDQLSKESDARDELALAQSRFSEDFVRGLREGDAMNRNRGDELALASGQSQGIIDPPDPWNFSVDPAELQFIPASSWSETSFVRDLLVNYFSRSDDRAPPFVYRLWNALRLTAELPQTVILAGVKWVTESHIKVYQGKFAEFFGVDLADTLWEGQGLFRRYGFVKLSETEATAKVRAEDLTDVDFETVYIIEDPDGQFTTSSLERSIWVRSNEIHSE
jgi:hypothetical protein